MDAIMGALHSATHELRPAFEALFGFTGIALGVIGVGAVFTRLVTEDQENLPGD